MDWLTLIVVAASSFLFALAIERIMRARADDTARRFEIEQQRRISTFKNLTHVQMSAFGAFVAWYDTDTNKTDWKWVIPSADILARMPTQDGNGRPRDADQRRDALRLLSASDRLYPQDVIRLASQDDMQAEGMSPTRHSEVVNWLAAQYGVLVSQTGKLRGTFCGPPFPERPALWQAVITLVGEKPPTPGRAGWGDAISQESRRDCMANRTVKRSRLPILRGRTPFVRLVRRVRREYRTLASWRKVGALYGVPGASARHVAFGREPHSDRLRQRFGLPLYITMQACANCGIVHIKSCRAPRPSSNPELLAAIRAVAVPFLEARQSRER